jgi:hypothetical protein
MTVQMTREQYETLLVAATAGDPAVVAVLQPIVDAANGITRYVLHVRWQNVGGTVPSRIELGRGWPVEQTYVLRLERRIERADVDTVLAQNATNPASTMVTPDPAGEVGWTYIDSYTF